MPSKPSAGALSDTATEVRNSMITNAIQMNGRTSPPSPNTRHKKPNLPNGCHQQMPDPKNREDAPPSLPHLFRQARVSAAFPLKANSLQQNGFGWEEKLPEETCHPQMIGIPGLVVSSLNQGSVRVTLSLMNSLSPVEIGRVDRTVTRLEPSPWSGLETSTRWAGPSRQVARSLLIWGR